MVKVSFPKDKTNLIVNYLLFFRNFCGKFPKGWSKFNCELFTFLEMAKVSLPNDGTNLIVNYLLF